MSIRSVKERFKQLQRGPLRSLVAAAATIQQSIKCREPVLIYADREGDWHNKRAGATFVSPELNVSPPEAVRSAVLELWCYDYEVKNGDTVIDIGAGIGDDVVIFSRLVGASGRVIAVEAHPHTFRCLEKTIAANRLGNVIALQIAASDRNGEVTISDDESFLGNSIVNSTGPLKIRSRPLDEVATELGVDRFDLIKMNIEGAETAALQGMTEMMTKTSHVVISCHDFITERGGDDQLRTYEDVGNLLAKAGYDLRSRKDDPRPHVKYYLYGKSKDTTLTTARNLKHG